MTTTTTTLCLLATVLLAAAETGPVLAAAASGRHDGTTHLHLYIHEKYTGANATTASLVASPLGGNSSFGSLGSIDDELREGSDRASRLVGRAQGLVLLSDLQNPAAFFTTLTLVFTDGDYSGSTLAVYGRVDLGPDGRAAGGERAVVGGTGKFRWARGYSLMSKFGNPTPSTVVLELDLYVKTDM